MTALGIESVVRGRRTAVLMLADAAALLTAYLFAVVVRYDAYSADLWRTAVVLAFVAIVLQWVLGVLGGVYHGRVGVATNEETLLLGAATTTVALALFVANASVQPHWISRSLPVTGTFLGLFLMLTARALWRHFTLRLAPLTSGEGQPHADHRRGGQWCPAGALDAVPP